MTATATYETAIKSLAEVCDEFGTDEGYGERHGAVLVVAAMFGVKPSAVKADLAALAGSAE